MKADALHGLTRLFVVLPPDNRGVSAIEFAIAAPFVFILVLGTVELAVDMMIDATVQIAAQAASRAGLTTTSPMAGTRDEQAKSIATKILGSWAKLPNTTVTITERAFGSYGNVGSSRFTPGSGALGDVVSYDITLTTPGISGIPQLVGFPTLTFRRSYIVQNEK